MLVLVSGLEVLTKCVPCSRHHRADVYKVYHPHTITSPTSHLATARSHSDNGNNVYILWGDEGGLGDGGVCT